MRIKPPSISFQSSTLCNSLVATTILLCGCSQNKINGPRSQNPDLVVTDDFVDPNAQAPSAEQSAQELASQDYLSQQNTTDQSTDLSSESVTLTSPSIIEAQASQPPVSTPITNANQNGTLSLLDAKVGDVNGKPIFTNSFFAPIEDRLTAEAGRLALPNWRNSAGQTIANRLDGIIADELLRAEALTSLTPTQRVGLQAFLNNFRTNLLSENLGSSQLASRRIQQEEGVTLDEALRQKEVDTLVQLTLITEVNRRVNVSWRDIKQRYERDIDEFSPPPTAMFRVIRVNKDDADTVNEVQSQLDSGTDFLKLAAGPLNNFNSDADGFHTVVIEDSFENTTFFGPEVLNEPTRNLSIGESAGPIELGSSIYWIKLMDIVQESISLYDAQLQIQRDLTFERRREAQKQYLDRLMERARVSSRDEVFLRLLQIAEERYGPQG